MVQGCINKANMHLTELHKHILADEGGEFDDEEREVDNNEDSDKSKTDEDGK